MDCISCHINLPDGAKFCLDCGAKQSYHCPCGTILPPAAKFCMECGLQTSQSAPKVEEQSLETEDEATEEDLNTLEDLEENETTAPEESAETEEEAESEQEEESAEQDEESAEQDEESAETEEEEDCSDELESEQEDCSDEQEPEAEQEEESDEPEQEEESAELEPEQEDCSDEEEEEFSGQSNQQLEFYGSSLRENNDILVSFYRGNLYFYDNKNKFVGVASENGEKKHMLFPCLDHPDSIVVNETGIYLHFSCEKEIPGIHQYAFNGSLKATMDVPNHALIRHIYIYEDIAYVAVTELAKPGPRKLNPERRMDICNLEEKMCNNLIYYLNFSDNTQKAFNFHGEQGYFNLICANEEEIIFKGHFNATVAGETRNEEGYYRYHKANNTIASLSHTQCQPHWIVSDQERFIKTHVDNPNASQGLNIPFFDMAENLMWVQQEDENGSYLEPRSIDSPSKSRVRDDLPKWYYNFSDYNFHKVYFDGKCMYYPQNYYTFQSILPDGTQVMLTEEENIHGVCEKFLVMHDHIYIDLTGHGLKQHKAEAHSLPFVRDVKNPHF